jgi:hypothetical protein
MQFFTVNHEEVRIYGGRFSFWRVDQFYTERFERLGVYSEFARPFVASDRASTAVMASTPLKYAQFLNRFLQTQMELWITPGRPTEGA